MFLQTLITPYKKNISRFKSVLYWILISLYLGYFLYTLVIIGFAIVQSSFQESSWLNYLILDGFRLFGFVVAIKTIILYALLHTNKSAYFLTLALTAISCNYFWLVEYNSLELSFNLIFLVVTLLSWKSFNLYHPKFNLERRLLLILTFFTSLLFFQRWGFKVLKTSFLHHFGFVDLITSYLNVEPASST